MTDIDIYAHILNTYISAVIQYIYCGILGLEQLLGFAAHPTAACRASGHSNFAL